LVGSPVPGLARSRRGAQLFGEMPDLAASGRSAYVCFRPIADIRPRDSVSTITGV